MAAGLSTTLVGPVVARRFTRVVPMLLLLCSDLAAIGLGFDTFRGHITAATTVGLLTVLLVRRGFGSVVLVIATGLWVVEAGREAGVYDFEALRGDLAGFRLGISLLSKSLSLAFWSSMSCLIDFWGVTGAALG